RLIVNVIRGAIIAGQFVVVVHLDRIERAKFGAQPAVHADVDVDKKRLWLRNWPLGLRVLTAHDPDTLRRANLGADTAARAPVVSRTLRMVVVFDNQERYEAEPLRHGEFLFRILDGEDTLRFRPLSNLKRRIRQRAAQILLRATAHVCRIGGDEMLEGNPQALHNALSEHGNSLFKRAGYGPARAVTQSAVGFAQHDVDTAKHGDNVRHLVALAHLPQRRQVNEAWGTDVIAPRVLRTLLVARRNDIEAQLAFRVLDTLVGLAHRHARHVRLVTGENRLAFGAFQSWQNLLENANAFAHLVDTHEIAVINIAVVANSDVEIEFWIDAIRIGA